MEAINNKLAELAAEKLSETDCFLVEILIAGNKVNVFIDSDSFVKIDMCAKVSRHLEAYLDEEQPLGEKYTIEVSSAGMTRPLVHPRQLIKHQGKELDVLLNNGERIKGALVKSNVENITINKTKVKKGKVIESTEIPIELNDIKTIKRVINF